jgi:hypothetical protein
MRPTEMTWALIALLLLTATDGSQVLKHDGRFFAQIYALLASFVGYALAREHSRQPN